jgi:hypothetical protein
MKTPRLKPGVNSGPATINRRRVVTIVDADGRPVEAGDLTPGKTYTVDLETGELKHPPDANGPTD